GGRDRVPNDRFEPHPDSGYWHGHPPGARPAHLRAVLLNQRGEGHRPGAVGLAGHCPGARWVDQTAQPRRARHDLQRRTAHWRPDTAWRTVASWSLTMKRASPSRWARSSRWTATTFRSRPAVLTL